MDEVISGRFASDQIPWSRDYVRVITWNIERGIQFSGILDFLRTAEADLIFLQEVDLNARRTQHRDVANDLARALRLNYIFGKQFRELSEGSHDSPAFQGLATLSPWPLAHVRTLHFQHQSAFWKPCWYIPNMTPFQRRLGGRIALACDVAIDKKRVIAYNLHLESRGTNLLREEQLKETLADAENNERAVMILGGDFNMEPTNSRAAPALEAAGLREAIYPSGVPTTVARRLRRPKSIDRIYVSRATQSQARVHTSIQASDHHPVSAVLRF